jgi:hypothetical protein
MRLSSSPWTVRVLRALPPWSDRVLVLCLLLGVFALGCAVGVLMQPCSSSATVQRLDQRVTDVEYQMALHLQGLQVQHAITKTMVERLEALEHRTTP